MDTMHMKFVPAVALDPVVAQSIRTLAKSIQSLSYTLVGDLHSGADMAESLLFVHGELERLSTEAEEISAEILRREQGSNG